jgi:elongation factor G
VIDLIDMKAFEYEGEGRGNATESEIPDDLRAQAEEYREKLMDEVAENSDELMERYLEGEEISHDEIVTALKQGVTEGHLFPVTCGVATKNLGTNRLLEALVEDVPSPAMRGGIPALNGDGEEIEIEPDTDGDPVAYVFKTTADPYTGRINLLRVYSGVLSSDSQAFNVTRKEKERIGQLSSPCGKETSTVGELGAGDIGAVAKLQASHTGDTWSTKDAPVQLPPVELPEPLLAYAISPKTKGDEDKLATGLARLREEDPSFRVARNDETHETVVYGMGEAHLDVQMNRLKDKFGVEVTTTPAKIAYRETIRGRVTAQGRHVKQTGGHGQYAVCTVEVEPLPRGEGFVYEDKIFGGAIPQQFIPSVEKGIVKTMADGVISGNPMVDVKVTLVDGKFHTVDSSDMAFQIAGSLALKEAAEQAGVALLEPIVQLSVIVPESYTGDVMGDLNAKRGKIQGMDQIGGGKQRINALVPQGEVARYVIDLRSMTGGRGAFTMTFSHYEEMPSHLASKVIQEYQAAREEAHKK